MSDDAVLRKRIKSLRAILSSDGYATFIEVAKEKEMQAINNMVNEMNTDNMKVSQGEIKAYRKIQSLLDDLTEELKGEVMQNV